MGFLRTNDLSEAKNGEFDLDFKVVIKTGELVVCKLKIRRNKILKELLKALGHWVSGPRLTERSRVHLLALGRRTYSHFPNRIFI